MSIVIVGAGPQLGLAVARRFGGTDQSVALVSRSGRDDLADQLTADGVTARAYAADVHDVDALQAAVAQAESDLGPVDVLSYSPLPDKAYLKELLDTTVEDVRSALEFSVLGPYAAVAAVLPGMRERGRGSVLVTTGGSALTPMTNVSGTSIAMAAEAAWLDLLQQTVTDDGVRVRHLVVRVKIGEDVSAEDLADRLWDLHDGPAADDWRVEVG